MACEAFQMICATQCSDELACQPFAALAADLPTALRFRRLLLVLQLVLFVLQRVCHGAHGGVCAVLRCEALRPGRGEGVQGVGGLSREAIVARVVGMLLVLRRALAVHCGRCRRVHRRQRLFGGGRRGGGDDD